MDNNFHDDRLKQLLKEMPKIEDQQDKDVLFNQISSKVNQNKIQPSRNKRTWIFPSLASAFVLLLIVVIAQSSLTNMRDESSLSNDMADSPSTFDSAEESAELSITEEEQGNTSSTESATDQSENESLAKNDLMNTLESNIVYEEPNTNIIHAIGLTQDVNHILPISLIDASSQQIDYDYYYDQLSNFIDEEAWGVLAYPFEDINFDVNEEQHDVTLTIPESYQFGGEAIQGLFQAAISRMFRPYGLETATIEYEGNNELGMLGNIDNFELTTNETQLYKIYQLGEDYPSFLIPLNTQNNLQWALEAMRDTETGANIHAPIPTDVYVEIASMDPLTIAVSDETGKLGNNQDTLNMIEAILVTAKSYDYPSVKFNMPVKQVGPYDLSEPLPVPEAINPDYLH